MIAYNYLGNRAKGQIADECCSHTLRERRCAGILSFSDVIEAWNVLPCDVINSNGVNEFMQLLDI